MEKNLIHFCFDIQLLPDTRLQMLRDPSITTQLSATDRVFYQKTALITDLFNELPTTL